MKVKYGKCQTDPLTRLSDLVPGDVFVRANVAEPKTIYLVLEFCAVQNLSPALSARRRETWARRIEQYRKQGRYPIADIKNNRDVPLEHLPLSTRVRKINAELCIHDETG